MAHFLERPIRIHETSWLVGGNITSSFNPWALFFSDPAVKKRLDNFARIRCNLHVKVLVNGTPFHYGRAIMSYNPWTSSDQVSIVYIGSQEEIVLYSQRPKIFIDPTRSMGGEMVLPFIHIDNWINVQSLNSFGAMGDLKITSFDILRHVSGGTEKITLSVFAWASDVKLCVPTTKLSAQAGKGNLKKASKSKKDEYSGSGVISKPASAIAMVAGALEKVPIIAPFAMATRMAADTVGEIAKMFGFSRPPILTNTVFYKPQHSSNLAATDTPDTVSKLTFDSKQELTVDSRTIGMDGADELLISSITSRETYLTQFVWTTSAIPDSFLWGTQVAPMLEFYKGNGIFYPTALSFATWPFEAWSGTLIFRFQVVCSSFHHGRLIFSYEPNGVGTDTSDQFNTAYTEIVDIGEETDFELSVSWTNKAPYAHTQWNKYGVHYSDSDANVIGNSDYDNGIMTVRVLNELTAPSDAADVKINVFVRAGDDFELNLPYSENIADTTYFNEVSQLEGQSGEGDLMTGAENDSDPDRVDVIPLVGNPEPNVMEMKSQIFYGEAVTSFRTLLRRYSRYRVWMYGDYVGVNGDTVYSFLQTPAMCKQPGYNPVGDDTTSIGTPYQYASMTLLHYLLPAYLGWRGSRRSKFRDITRRGDQIDAWRRYDHELGPFPSVFTDRVVAENSANRSRGAYNGRRLPSYLTGAVIQPSKLSPYMEVEYPFVTGKRFAFARNIREASSTVDNTNGVLNAVSIMYSNSGSGLKPVEEFISVGEDFSLFFFINAPVRRELAIPLPAS